MTMKKNRKGFTLIELLAVIVILGILMMTAIPAVTRAIAKSRRNTYWQNMKSYAKAAATPFLDGEYQSTENSGESCPYPGSGQYVIIPVSIVELEQGDITKSSFKSPYVTSGNCQPTIAVLNEGTDGKDNLKWYVVGMDQAGNGLTNYVDINKLGLSDVKTGATCTSGASIIDLSDPGDLKVGAKTYHYKDTCQ